MLAILLIPASLCYTFGKMSKILDRVGVTNRHDVDFCGDAVNCRVVEQSGNGALQTWSRPKRRCCTQPGGNMEGKELRFGSHNSSLVGYRNYLSFQRFGNKTPML